MDIFDLKKSVTEMSDEELQALISDTRRERRIASRTANSKPKATAVAKSKPADAPIDYSKLDPERLQQISQLFAGILEAKKKNG